MKDDLKRLLNEFLVETREYRTEKVDTQLTDKMPESFKEKIRRPDVDDLISWLNGEI